MATVPNDIQKQINEMYNRQQKAQLDALAQSQQKATSQINQQKTQTTQQYYDKRNQADAGFFQNRKALAEMMAANGLNRSGENITANVGLNAARQNSLGGLNRDEQNILGQFNQQITEINDPSKRQSIIDQIEAQRSQTLAEALEREMERRRQQEQFEAQMAWEREKFNRQMAEQAAARARSGGGGSGGRSGGGSSSKKAPKMTKASTYAHGNTYWRDRIQQMKQDPGAFRGAAVIEREILNSPEAIREIEAQGYNLDSFIDSLYNVSTNGQFKTKKEYAKWYQQQFGTPTQTSTGSYLSR